MTHCHCTVGPLSVQTSYGTPTPPHHHHDTAAEFNFLTIHAQPLITHRSTTFLLGREALLALQLAPTPTLRIEDRDLEGSLGRKSALPAETSTSNDDDPDEAGVGTECALISNITC